jgi:peptidoglycan/LPS O-acetylase OafA/YrhL
MSRTYLKGLNSLRFFAAFFVIIQHGQISLAKLGFTNWSGAAVFMRGGDAVEFFYVLSGFLITFLLQQEITRTSTISIRKFYLRRVFRIWPLYFLVVIIGFLFLGFLYPKLTGQVFFDFPVWKGLLLFFCFLPNLATSLYSTGLLFPLRTIGVEEQYYLFWAPLVKGFRNKLPGLIGVFVVISYLFYAWVIYGDHQIPETALKFLKSLKFYAMATGALFGYFFYRYPEQYRRSFLGSRPFQWLVLLVTGYYYLAFPVEDDTIAHFIMCSFYGLLILNCALLDKPVINLERKPFVYLGVISYGLYTCHMLVDYTLRFTIMKLRGERVGFAILAPVYMVALLGGAIIMAGLSYKYYESFFLRLKGKYAE